MDVDDVQYVTQRMVYPQYVSRVMYYVQYLLQYYYVSMQYYILDSSQYCAMIFIVIQDVVVAM